MRGLLLVLLASAVFTALVGAVHMDTHMGQVPAGELKDTKICYAEHECQFYAHTKMKQKEHAETAGLRSDRDKTKMNLHIHFKVQSQCGSKTHQFYKMCINEYKMTRGNGVDPKKDPSTRETPMRKYCVYFDQSRTSGNIEKIYFCKGDKNFSRRMKQSILKELSKKVHPSAMAQASPTTDVAYTFVDEDNDGQFSATHRLRRDAETDDVTLLETKMYAPDFVQKHGKVRGGSVGGQKFDIKRKTEATANIGGSGHVRELQQTDNAALGTTRPPDHKPVTAVADSGQTSFGGELMVERRASGKIQKHCRTDAEMRSHSELLLSLRNEPDMEDFEAREFRKPWTAEELAAEEGWGEKTSDEKWDTAKKLLLSGKFNVNDLAWEVDEGNVAKIAELARRLYGEKKLDLKHFKTSLGALSTVRSKESYNALLDALHSKGAPFEIRQQALVSLLHTDDERSPPKWVVDTVADLGESDEDYMHKGAIMLLGTMLRDHVESDVGKPHLQKIVSELRSISPANANAAPRSVVLMGALHNLGDKVKFTAGTVGPFLVSPFKQSRSAAIDALRAMGVDYQKREEMRQWYTLKQRAGTQQAANLMRMMKGSAMEDIDESVPLPTFPSKVRAPARGGNALDVDIDTDPDTDSEGYSDSDLDLDEDMQVPTQGAGAMSNFNNYNPKDSSRDDKDRKEGGRLVEMLIPLAGSPNFGLNVHMNAGANFDQRAAAAMGNFGLTIAVFFFKMEVLNLGVNYGFDGEAGKGVQIKLDGSVEMPKDSKLAFVITILGKKVLEETDRIGEQDMQFGGKCPLKVWEAPIARRRPDRDWFIPFFMFGMGYGLGPFGIQLKIMVGGGLGYKPIGAMFLNCVYEGQPKQMELMGGIQPFAFAEIRMEASLNLGVAKAGIEGVLQIVRGDVPIYGYANTQMACGRIDLELTALSGKVIGFVDVKFVGRVVKLPILKWKGPSIRLNLHMQCKVVGYGHFPPLTYEKKKEAKKEVKTKQPWWVTKGKLEEERDAKYGTYDQRRLMNEKGTDGLVELCKMRRAYQKKMGYPVDPPCGTGHTGWPFNTKTFAEMNEKHDLLPPKRSPPHKMTEHERAMHHELDNRDKTDYAASKAGVDYDGQKLRGEAYEHQVAAARVIEHNADQIANGGEDGYGRGTDTGLPIQQGPTFGSKQWSLEPPKLNPLDPHAMPPAHDTQGVPKEFRVHAKDVDNHAEHYSPLELAHHHAEAVE